MVDQCYVMPATGQCDCFDEFGKKIPCEGSGQDGELRRGQHPPSPRFHDEGELIQDNFTGLYWTRDAALCEYPLMWQEALNFVMQLNEQALYGYEDWRMPSRSELMSLLCYQQTRPPLPKDHPFLNLFPGWYWSSTTAVYHPAHAWYLDMNGGRLFYGGKEQSFMLWPVRGKRPLSPRGQHACYDPVGRVIDCSGSGQDGEWFSTVSCPRPRFQIRDECIFDRWSGLEWLASADLTDGPVSWRDALDYVRTLPGDEERPWHLPNINELESLVDYDQAEPALSPDMPLTGWREAYWSSTTSMYEPDWAWALYMEKGAIGVGEKRGRHFHVMAVR